MAGVEGGVEQGSGQVGRVLEGQVAVDVGVEVQGGVRGLLREEVLRGGEDRGGRRTRVLLTGVALARVGDLLGLSRKHHTTESDCHRLELLLSQHLCSIS